jgi:peptidylprolyl isomerase
MRLTGFRTFLAAASALAVAGAASAGPADDPANWRKVDPENLLQFTIKRQDFLIELRPDFAPAHVAQIKTITRAGHYNALPFHRVIDDFMAQGGETSAIYMLSTPYPSLKLEAVMDRKPADHPVQWFGKNANGDQVGYLDGFIVNGQPDELASMTATGTVKTWALHCAGITSMARTDAPNSADTQFFLMRQARDALDKGYTIWGRALTGLDIIRGIKAGPEETDGRMAPGVADKLSKAVVVADLPDYKKPTVYVQRTDGPLFAAALKAAAATPGDEACSLPPVPVVVEMPPSE